MRDPRHCVQDLLHAVDDHGANETRSGAPGLGNHRRAERHHRLAQVVLGHRTVAAREKIADEVGNVVIQLHLDAHHRGDGVAGEIVVSGPKTATHDHRIGSGQRRPKGLGHPAKIVANLHL